MARRGSSRVLSFSVQDGQSLALLGRNGVGKTTLIDLLIGVTTRFGGKIALAGEDIDGSAATLEGAAGSRLDAAGAQHLPLAHRRREPAPPSNCRANGRRRASDGLFPRLQERRSNMGRQLSGGEQQMLAIGRALVLNPRLLLLDEPTEGLAPIIVDELLGALRELARAGLSMIIVEQKPKKILPFTDEAIVLDRGSIAYAAPSAELIADPAALDAHLTATKKAER